MATVFFHYFLREDADAGQFEQQILTAVAPRALAEASVESWVLHRCEPWTGASDEIPDYICVVGVANLPLWSGESAESIAESHGELGGLVREIGMVVSGEIVKSHSIRGAPNS
jgi:hypothetical protein